MKKKYLKKIFIKICHLLSKEMQILQKTRPIHEKVLQI